MEKQDQLIKAVLCVMKEVKGIEKNLTVGSGNSSYRGVSDKDVKNIIGEAMAKNGLIILPTHIVANMKVDRWEAEYNGVKQQKQSVFTEACTNYTLMHESGQSMVIAGYGHGVDSQDKSAGKATTYALKNALLYMFLVPTGAIDDTDNSHSDSIAVPNKPAAKQLPYLVENSESYYKVVDALTGDYTIADVEKKFFLSKEIKAKLIKIKENGL